MNRFLLTFFCLCSTQAFAGNVIELLERDMSGKEINRMTFYTESARSRMDQSGVDGSTSVIFLNDEFLILNHEQKTYMVMDEAMLQNIGAQVSEAMQEMEAQLAGLPPEQREMVERMMIEQMGDAGTAMDTPVLEVRKVGSDRRQTYDCTLAEMLEDGTKIQEVCSVDYAEVDGSGDLRDSFMRMARLFKTLSDAIPFGETGSRNPMAALRELDGFPVHTVDFENGEAVSETVLESAGEKPIDAGIFDVPPDYSRTDPFKP